MGELGGNWLRSPGVLMPGSLLDIWLEQGLPNQGGLEPVAVTVQSY
jgi:hypothetical protein